MEVRSHVSGHEQDEDRPPDSTAMFAAVPEDATTHTGRPEPSQDPESGTALSGEDLRGIAALPPGSALLIVQSGANVGARFLLDADHVSAGRRPASDIFLDDVTVSRRHATFVRTDAGYSVRDAGSLNGTYVNRDRVDVAPLGAGDEVQIGKYRLTYHPRTDGQDEQG